MSDNIFTRWRHSKGYGVHSPLAFRIVTECVRPPRGYAFYADDLIDAKFNGLPDKKRYERMKIRLANLIYPSHLTCIDNPARLEALAPKIADKEEYTLLLNFKVDDMATLALLPHTTLIISGRRFTILARRAGMALVAYPVL